MHCRSWQLACRRQGVRCQRRFVVLNKKAYDDAMYYIALHACRSEPALGCTMREADRESFTCFTCLHAPSSNYIAQHVLWLY
jgi:hypothetical protein